MTYTVTTYDSSADGMERLRNQNEFIVIAYPCGDSSPADIRSQWVDDVQSCARDDEFDYDAARAAINQFCDANESLIIRELREFNAMAQSGELNWNDEDAPEFDSVSMRLYIAINEDES